MKCGGAFPVVACGSIRFSPHWMFAVRRYPTISRFYSSGVLTRLSFCSSSSTESTEPLKEGSVGRKEFTSSNWTQERQQAVTESLLETQKHLQNKWRQTEEMSGGDEGSAEDVIINANTGEVGGPKGPEPTRYVFQQTPSWFLFFFSRVLFSFIPSAGMEIGNVRVGLAIFEDTL